MADLTPEQRERLADALHAESVCLNPGHAEWHGCAKSGPCSGDADAIAPVVADLLAEAEQRGVERGARGIRFRVEVACDGYANLMDEDVPGGWTDLATYQQGAHDAAEAIRATLADREATR